MIPVSRIITRNSEVQPIFTPTQDGFVLFQFLNVEWLISMAKAEELLAELKNATRVAA